MPAIMLVLLWIATGLLMGILARAAHLQLPGWRWFWLPIVGAGAALSGGLLGLLILGRLFSISVALWVAILALCLPGLYTWTWKRLTRR